MDYPPRPTPPDRTALAALIADIAPGARLLHVRRLRGGLSADVHAVELQFLSGERRKYVVRRHRPAGRHALPADTERESLLLSLLWSAGMPVPEPILADAGGAYFGVPMLVTAYAGRPLVQPRQPQPWLRQLAEALCSIHTINPERHDLSFLHTKLAAGMGEELARGLPPRLRGMPLAEEVHGVLTRRLGSISWPAPTLVHDDYWPGNTVWVSNKLTAVVDWTDAQVSDPRADVSQCRIDLTAMHSEAYADSFLDAYQRSRPDGPLPEVWFFDLFRGLRALGSLDRWLPGYHDIGLTHLSFAPMMARLEQFLRHALERAR